MSRRRQSVAEVDASDEQVVECIVGCLDEPLADLGQLRSRDPLPRRVGARSPRWGYWLGPGGPRGRSQLIVPSAEGTAALSALEELTTLRENGLDVYVDRARLSELAADAARGDHQERVRLFVAGQIWGSGTSNGRGPWQTALGLGSPRLGCVLEESAAASREWAPGQAWAAWDVYGIGMSFATKWFWACTLDLQPGPNDHRPLILDARVSATLELLGWRTHRRPSLGGYQAWVEAAHRWAILLRRHGYRGTDAAVSLYDSDPDDQFATEDQLVWRVQADGAAKAERFVVGAVPDGFERVRSLEEHDGEDLVVDIR